MHFIRKPWDGSTFWAIPIGITQSTLTTPTSFFDVLPKGTVFRWTRGPSRTRFHRWPVGKDCQNRLAWNNRLTATSSVGWHIAVMVNRGAGGQPYCRGRGEIR